MSDLLENPYSEITLTKKQLNALVEWAKEVQRENGCTAYGPKFDAAILAAQQIVVQASRLDTND